MVRGSGDAVTGVDWGAWHRTYDSHAGLAQRLAIVRGHVAAFVTESAAPAIRLASMCAGDGRDVILALADHPRRSIVRGRLVELDPELAATARGSIAEAGLDLTVAVADAGQTDAYAEVVPVDLLLACGVFGNISDTDIEGTIHALPTLLATGATVIWTRSRREPDVTPMVREWFATAGFHEVAFTGVPDGPQSVGVHRLVAEARPFEAGRRLFEFVR